MDPKTLVDIQALQSGFNTAIMKTGLILPMALINRARDMIPVGANEFGKPLLDAAVGIWKVSTFISSS